MAEIDTSSSKAAGPAGAVPATPGTPTPSSQKRGPSIHQIYALPAPIRTFPLPTFYPNNPVSLFHIISTWLSQTFSPPPAEPSVVHQGTWSDVTTSVHVTDEKSMRALWEQGFYGKGSLSRSEPNWLKREEVRRGLQEAHVSELLTVQRRQERAQAKWERARLEQEAIRSTKLEEARQAVARSQATLANLLPPQPVMVAPVGPLELLLLPNSAADLLIMQCPNGTHEDLSMASGTSDAHATSAPVGRLGAAPESGRVEGGDPLALGQKDDANPNGEVDGSLLETARSGGDDAPRTPSKSAASSDSCGDSVEAKSPKRQKSVRFSPKVESTTFQLFDPPSPNHSTAGKAGQPLANGDGKLRTRDIPVIPLVDSDKIPGGNTQPIVNKEHLQLTPEEAFFLTFGLGALRVVDGASGEPIPTAQLFRLFRQHSYFPPRIGPEEPELEPDDGFLVHYAVYHHFRSLGWVPRAGIKFGVDWLLYTRGPVFDHAEFGLMVVPSYSDPWWKESGKKAPHRTWAWLHSIVRVLSHVTKSLVLVYVDIPPPPKFEEALDVGIAEALKLYKVREVMVKRWSSNRNR
ncbi:tRNA splicing endonuclease subunit sen2 [Purpureocillium takamizusanense]|uniref:tRNA-intron lyase n=1 Tax=Purpureocillium takamizusanense TaxID=2060973 RepID=A0A9Q8V9R7_9HYPO|nr:tRNA splicing endonuclease subunit sen2 [Purpureocillium takamizusanense]UNI18560.1 tRNA splicing endonuclease subunit sen2 [Purpureocillium takamizusanense]